jgi:hypothetical protein
VNLKNVIINSIGTATPTVGKVLADVLGVDNNQVVRMLYCTPAVLFHKVDDELATKATNLLTQLGLEAEITVADAALPSPPPLYDLAVFLPNPLQLADVGEQLAVFLGCTSQDALNLLLQDPPVVLGGVSQATAQALSQRLDAEVVMADPRAEKYTLQLCTSDAAFTRQWVTTCQTLGLTPANNGRMVEDADYTTAQQLWQRLGNSKNISIHNQGFQRYEIILEAIEHANPNWQQALTDIVGMPADILDDVISNLPVQLNDSLNRHDVQQLLEQYTAAGLQCSIAKLPFGNQQLLVDDISKPDEASAILSRFYGNISLGSSTSHWQAPRPISPVLGRLAAQQLEQIGCAVTTTTSV